MPCPGRYAVPYLPPSEASSPVDPKVPNRDLWMARLESLPKEAVVGLISQDEACSFPPGAL